MASISTDPKGNRTIQFCGTDGKRRSIRLGQLPEADVTTIKDKIDVLEIYRKMGHGFDAATVIWLGNLDATIYNTLAAGGLAAPRATTKPAPAAVTLGDFLVEYLAGRKSLVEVGKITADTLRIESVTRDCLVAKFGKSRALKAITEGDAEDFRNYLLTQGGQPVKRCGPATVIRKRTPLSEATTRKRCSVASKFFRYAMRRGLVARNPFDNEAVPKANIATTRTAEISVADAQLVIEKLPSTEWKLLFALSRFGGLRVGSEVRKLTWADIDWETNRMLVHSPKTARYQGHGQRWLPIFPELAELLERRYDEADEGDYYVLPMLTDHEGNSRRSDASLRDMVERAIIAAGLDVWPRLWHNLRATRQTELTDQFPAHVVCAWLGNSKIIAEKHYLRVTDEHFAKAAAERTTERNMKTIGAVGAPGGAVTGGKRVQRRAKAKSVNQNNSSQA